jgi:hypothetical protein
MKQDAVTEKLKEAIKLHLVPQQARLPKPVARFVEAGIPSDEDSESKQLWYEYHKEPVIDTASFDYPLPTTDNSAIIQDCGPTLEINFLFEYRALQE